jgi:hypothetical protein
MTHEGLDGVPGKPAEHLRALLQHHGHLPPRDPYLARFEQWIVTKLTGCPTRYANPSSTSPPGTTCAASAPKPPPVHLPAGRCTRPSRRASTCTQADVDEWLATGPTTRTAIRTFFLVAKKTRLNTKVAVQHRAARTSPSLTQDQRLAWINELLIGTSESLPYRVAGMLLLLYAQPLVKVATLKLNIIDEKPDGMSILLGQRPADVPEPFAQLLRDHIAQRPHLRTGAGSDSPWLFPSTLAGRHLHPNTVMHRLRDLGVNLLGARNRAIGELVLEVPPSVVAEALGYSPQVAFLHADKAAEPWARYAGRRIAGR